MSWVTSLWSLAAAFCFTLAGIYLLVWFRERARWDYLLFSCSGVAAGVFTGLELALIRAETTAQFGLLLRWIHLAVAVLIVSNLWFSHLYLRAGRRWLVWTICGLRALVLVLNFTFTPNINYREIHSLRHVPWWGGETIAVPVGTPNPWTLLTQVSLFLLLIFFIDATVTVWRRGDRRRAFAVGGSAIVALTISVVMSVLIIWGFVQGPVINSFVYLFIIAAMGYELSEELLRSAQLSRQFQASEAALRESEVRIDLVANAASLGLWLWNCRDEHLWVTKQWRKLFGFTETEPVTLSRFFDAVHAEDRAKTRRLVEEIFERGGEYESEYRISRPDGSTRWIAGYGSIELDASGKPSFARGVTRDITKRKLVEEELRESEARFRIVADVAPVMIWMSDTEKKGIFFNKGWLQFTGRVAEEELGAGWLSGIHPEDVAHTVDLCGAAFAKRQPFTVEYRLRRKDGEYRWLLDTGTPRFDVDGAFHGYIGSCIDIGDRKQAELDHQLQSMELARVGRLALMGELAASLAHEINNPLGAMVTNASAGQLMVSQGQIDTEEFQELLGDIVADGHRAREVIEGIRNMVRKADPSHGLVEIKDVMRDLVRIVRADALAKKVNLVTEVDVNAGAVLGDRVQLLQVLLNLTINAFEAMNVIRADARRVVISANRSSDGGVCMTVQDSGPGLAGGIADHLFEPFFSTKAEGTGMGLAIARSIVEAHGGTLTAENCPGGGARFTVCLPKASSAQSRAA